MQDTFGRRSPVSGVYDVVPSITLPPQLTLGELGSARVLRVVVAGIGVTIKAENDGIIEIVRATGCLRHYMMHLYSNPFVPMADAAVPGRRNQCTFSDSH